MTQYEREELVERYLNGEMTSAEEGEFFLVAAVDEELQRTLKAYRIMDRAMMNDRDTAVVENSRYRSRVMGMLAASHATEAGNPTAAAEAAPRPGGEIPTDGFWRGLGASLLGASIVAGMIVAISSVNDSATPAAPQPLPAQQASPAVASPDRSAPVTGERVPDATTPEVKENTAARPAERREIRNEARSAARQSIPREAVDAASQMKPTRRNPVITLPPKDEKKVNIPIEVEDPNAPKK